MDVTFALFGYRGFMLVFIPPPRRLVVMAQKDPRLAGQSQYLLHRLVQGLGVTAGGEIAAGGTGIRREQGVANKGRIADNVGQACRRVTRRVKDLPPLQVANPEGVALLKQLVKLATVPGKFGAGVEAFPKIS